MSRKVLYAKTHNQVNHVVGTGDMGNTFPNATKTLDNLQMEVSELGLILNYSYKGRHFETLFPLAAVSIMTLAPEENV